MQDIYGNYLPAFTSQSGNFIKNCAFLNNSAQLGGNIYASFPGNMTIKNSVFVNNSATISSVIYYEQQCNYFINYVN